eukprot:931829-Amorphochlora_amoeboformis.AAC.1
MFDPKIYRTSKPTAEAPQLTNPTTQNPKQLHCTSLYCSLSNASGSTLRVGLFYRSRWLSRTP